MIVQVNDGERLNCFQEINEHNKSSNSWKCGKDVRIYINIHVANIYIYVYICNHETNVLSRLSLQWLCGSSCTWAQPYIMCPSAWVATKLLWWWVDTLFSWLHIYYAHLASVRSYHSMYCGSLMTTYIYIYIYIYILILMFDRAIIL